MDGYPGIILAGTDGELPPGQVGEYEKYTDFVEMARGGKAVLHACRDRLIGRTVVLKRLRDEFKNDEVEQRRFLREARVTAQLQHPNTVPVYDLGRDDNGATFFTMKKILGENLWDILKKIHSGDQPAIDEFPPVRRIDIAADAAQALAFAHTHGVIHRDVKPENIWVGEFGEVILLDWGVAKVWGHSDLPGSGPIKEGPRDLNDSVESLRATGGHQSERGLTRSGQLLGTPLYMSPEQVLGHLYLDERTDVFSLGVVMYESLTFTEPFRGRDVRATFDLIIHDRPKPPSEIVEDLPDVFDAVIMKALEKKPEDRWQTAEEFHHAIRDVVLAAS